jgi:hypothetical protein
VSLLETAETFPRLAAEAFLFETAEAHLFFVETVEARQWTLG